MYFGEKTVKFQIISTHSFCNLQVFPRGRHDFLAVNELCFGVKKGEVS